MKNTTITANRRLIHMGWIGALLVLSQACTVQPTNSNTNVNAPTAAASPSASATPVPTSETAKALLTLPLLDALLREDAFVNQLRSKLQLTDAQVDELKRAAAEDLTRLREQNSEANAEDDDGNAAEARNRAHQRIASIIGESKTNELDRIAYSFGSRDPEGDKANDTGMPAKPNAVPADTRVVVNIPAFRMDLFRSGSLVKSYKIGIGYPQFPLPQGLRKAQTIIFNPSWTPPDSPWVAKMKDVTPGEKIEPGSSLNPLGPIKIPIGMPSLIHGGKSPAKLGQFASHGCVGLTNTQVKGFAKLIAEASGVQLSERDIAKYLEDRTKTHTVKLGQPVPVELRYETIVVEDGKLHIYKDVYDEGTNTEENLRSVLEANGSRFEDLSEDERRQVLVALNEMSAHPKPMAETSPANDNSKPARQKGVPASAKKKQKEVVLELAALRERGYPAPVDLDTGTGKPATNIARKQ